MKGFSLTDWPDHFKHGLRYMDIARKGCGKPEVFSNDLILQLTAMAVENILVSIYQYHGQLPADHTLSGLVENMAGFCPVTVVVCNLVKQIESYDDLCCLISTRRKSLSNDDISSLLKNGMHLVQFAQRRLPKHAASLNSEAKEQA